MLKTSVRLIHKQMWITDTEEKEEIWIFCEKLKLFCEKVDFVCFDALFSIILMRFIAWQLLSFLYDVENYEYVRWREYDVCSWDCFFGYCPPEIQGFLLLEPDVFFPRTAIKSLFS